MVTGYAIFESIIPSLLFGLWVGPSPLFGAHSTWYIDIGNLQTVVKHTLCSKMQETRGPYTSIRPNIPTSSLVTFAF